MPILSQGGFPEIGYVDGFAGPGRYSKGEDGSPIIALKAALEQRSRDKGRVSFLFIEERTDRAEMLKQVLDHIETPANFRVRVAGGTTFESEVTSLLDIREKAGRVPPMFALIDPFGWSGVPFELVHRLLSHRSCEVLVTFMYEEINRFLSLSAQVENFNGFFGTDAWEQVSSMTDPLERNRMLHGIYLRQLRESAGARFVRSFEMRNDRDLTDYYLFYASNNLLGLKKMKESMWRVDQSGEFRFSDATDPNQLVLFGREPQFDVLRQQVVHQFSGQETTVREIEEFVLVETAFRETHYKTQVLRPLETADPPLLIPIDPPANRRPWTYVDSSMRIRFN